MTSARGGKRAGAGRPPLSASPTVRITITLPGPLAARLRELGDGNASAGVRRLLEQNRGLRALLRSPYQGEYAYVSDQAIDAALLGGE